MENKEPMEFRIVFDGDMPEKSRKELELALQRTALDHVARMDLTSIAAVSRFPDLKLRPQWFGIWIKHGHALDLDRIVKQLPGRLGR